MPRPSAANHPADYVAQCIANNEAQLVALRSLHEDLKEKTLAERIAKSKEPRLPTKSLLQRLQPIPYIPPKPLPADLRFRKKHIIFRQKEYLKLIGVTSRRIELLKSWKKDRGVKEHHAEGMEILFGNFDRFKDSYDQNCDFYTNKAWRNIKRDLKAVGSIPLEDSQKNWDDICAEIAALGSQERFVFNRRD